MIYMMNTTKKDPSMMTLEGMRGGRGSEGAREIVSFGAFCFNS
jgi:hypothetical protein